MELLPEFYRIDWNYWNYFQISLKSWNFQDDETFEFLVFRNYFSVEL